MKTNQIITRKMGDFNVYQQTKDAYFDASALLQQWNENSRCIKKELSKFTNTKSTKEFMEELAKDIITNSPTEKNRYGDNQEVTLIYSIKGKNTKNGRTPDKVWMHPYLFIKFAMWLNPRFEVQVIKFVYDQLITLRNQIGDGYKEFSNACAKIGCVTPDDYKVMARCLNCAVLGKERQARQRNELTEKEADEIDKISNLFVCAVNNGWITNTDQAKAYFRKEYNDRFQTGLPFNNK